MNEYLHSLRFRYHSFALLVLLFLMNAHGRISAQQPQVPPDLSKWELICYCITSVGTPHAIIRADENGRILYFAREGATRDQIAAAVNPPAIASELMALRDWRMLIKSGDTYTTSIPVLGPSEMEGLRRRMKQTAATIVPGLGNDIAKIRSSLNQEGLQDHLYSVLFSYVFDGLTWDELDQSHAVPSMSSMRITAEHPFWEGTFWAIYPKRTEVQPGTNSSGTNQVTVLMTWTAPVLKQLGALQNAPGLNAALTAAATGNCKGLVVADTRQQSWNLSKPDGSCAVPVIHEDAADPIYSAGRDAAQQIAKALLSQNVQDLTGRFATPEQARLIAAHELIWEVLNKLVDDHIVSAPVVLQDAAADPQSLNQLLTIVVNKH